MEKKTKLDIAALEAIGARASQKMQKDILLGSPEQKKAGRKPVTDPAINKITVNLTNAEYEQLKTFCDENGLKNPAAVLRFCLKRVGVL